MLMVMIQTIVVIVSALCIGFFAGTLTTALSIANKMAELGFDNND
jgi:hypothetical protein